MAPLKRPRADQDDLEDDLHSDGASSGAQLSARKRARVSEKPRQGPFAYDSDASEDSDETGANQQSQAVKANFSQQLAANEPQPNGIIESIHCYNFMCHKNWKLDLNPLINFVIGKNGSGKSAALTALILCLGGKASATNRATNLKGFISEGQESATIVVKIKNQGDGAYNPEEYGDSIIVERHFTKSGTSGFKLKSANGRIISIKRGDLDDICDYFALQIDNPMNVLSQDMARQFIATSSPQEKYKFFVRGVQLEQLDRDYGIMEETIDNIEAKMGTRYDDVKILSDKKDQAQNQLKLSDSHQHIRERLRVLRRQMAWAQVEDQEKLRDEKSEELKKHDKYISDAEEEARAYDARFATAEQAAEEAVRELDEARVEVQAVEESKGEVKARFDNAKGLASDSQNLQRQIQQQLKNSETRIAKVKSDIEDEETRLTDLHGGSHGRKRAEIDEKKLAFEILQEQLRQYPQDRKRLEDIQADAKKRMEEVAAEREGKRNETASKEDAIASLRRDKGDISRGYDRKMPDLIRAIQNEASFRERPIGPIGHHVRLKDQEWSKALEGAFGATLSAFIVTSKADHGVLQRLMQKFGCISNILIGQNSSIDTTGKEPDADFQTWLRVLEIDNEAVKRQLVIAHGIEQVAFVKDNDEAYHVIRDLRPRNVRECYYLLERREGRARALTAKSSGELRESPVAWYSGPPRMKSDAEQRIRYEEHSLQELKRALNDVEAKYRETQKTHEKAKQDIVRHGRQERDLKVQLQRAEDEIDQLSTALEQESVEEGRIDALKEELNTAEDQKRIAEASFSDSVPDLDGKKAKMKDTKNELAAKENELTELRAKVDALDRETRKTDDKRRTELREKNEAYERINDRRQDRNRVEREHATLAARVEAFIPKATEICQRVTVPNGETSASIDQKLTTLGAKLQRAEDALGGTRPEIAEAARVATEAFETARRQVEDLDQLAQLLKEALRIRRFRWKKFRALISFRAKANFHYLLSERGFRGRLVTSHQEKLLDILIEPDSTRESNKGNQAKTLSGGEKSFSQICLLLALWEAMGSPIRALDEFDVYMDAANRIMSMRLLIDAARRSGGRQYIFITPGEGFSVMDNMPDVKFHNLAQPDRGQSTLSFPAV